MDNIYESNNSNTIERLENVYRVTRSSHLDCTIHTIVRYWTLRILTLTIYESVNPRSNLQKSTLHLALLEDRIGARDYRFITDATFSH